MLCPEAQGTTFEHFLPIRPGLDDVSRLLEQNYDVIIIELDSDPEYALELVESIGANGSATVMVYSRRPIPDLLMRCMRAGAREFLTIPIAPDIMAESLVRAAARRPAVAPPNPIRRRWAASCWRSWAPRAAPE